MAAAPSACKPSRRGRTRDGNVCVCDESSDGGRFDSSIAEYHAINWFIADDGLLRFIEPQSDAIYDAAQCRGNVSLLLV